MINNTSVVVKTATGLSAIQPQNNELLPREARNLLILIDGRKTMGKYLDQLNKMRMFKEVGGVEQYFRLLLDLELIRFDAIEGNPSPIESAPKASSYDANQQPLNSQNSVTEYSENTLFKEPLGNVKSLGMMHGKISTKMATIIEQYAQPSETWGLLMKLESCESDTELLLLLRTLAKADHEPVSKKMRSLMKSLKKAKLV